MKFRIARHTNDLNKIADFYQKVIGLELLGSFNGHEGYNGIFLGISGSDWHLEFTTSDTAPNHLADEDDLMVFYVKGKDQQEAIRTKCIEFGVPLLTAKNPYWNKEGIIIGDPDNNKIIIAALD